ncbi:MAG: hypothetical protein KIT14_07705 [bacterium]|nr:hypothetical protein [bacterium]
MTAPLTEARIREVLARLPQALAHTDGRAARRPPLRIAARRRPEELPARDDARRDPTDLLSVVAPELAADVDAMDASSDALVRDVRRVFELWAVVRGGGIAVVRDRLAAGPAALAALTTNGALVPDLAAGIGALLPAMAARSRTLLARLDAFTPEEEAAVRGCADAIAAAVSRVAPRRPPAPDA